MVASMLYFPSSNSPFLAALIIADLLTLKYSATEVWLIASFCVARYATIILTREALLSRPFLKSSAFFIENFSLTVSAIISIFHPFLLRRSFTGIRCVYDGDWNTLRIQSRSCASPYSTSLSRFVWSNENGWASTPNHNKHSLSLTMQRPAV